MRFLFAFMLLLLASPIYAQQCEYFKDFNFDSTYAVVGMPSWSNVNADHSFDFFINTPGDLEQLRKDWVFTKKAQSILDPHLFWVYVIKNKVIVRSGLINLEQGNIMAEATYVFRKKTLRKLHQSHPLNYQVQHLSFGTAEQYKAYRDSVIPLSSFLFITDLGKVYPGEFTVTVKKTDTTKSPAAAMNKISKQILKYASRSDYLDIYKPGKNNPQDDGSMIFTIECSKEIYDKYPRNIYEVGEWKPLLIETNSVWKR